MKDKISSMTKSNVVELIGLVDQFTSLMPEIIAKAYTEVEV